MANSALDYELAIIVIRSISLSLTVKILVEFLFLLTLGLQVVPLEPVLAEFVLQYCAISWLNLIPFSPDNLLHLQLGQDVSLERLRG